MVDFTFVSFSLITMASFCFLVGVWFIPVNKDIITFDLRLYVGLFSVLVYLITAFIWMAIPILTTTFYYFLLLLVIGMAVSIFSFMIAWITQYSSSHVDHTYFFALWFSGLFAAFLGTKMYAFVFGLVLVGVLFYGCFYLVNRFHLVSSIRTLVVTVDSFESIEYVKRLLRLLNANIISSDIKKHGRFQFTCKYRLAALGHHIFMRYVLKSDLLDDIVINESA
tara:strand:+ start:2952 stop:3620 length:669 start_codon:yes stop_codon:yes gene_type:complete